MQDKQAFRIGPLVIKTILVILTFGFLYFEIFQKHNLPELAHKYQRSIEHYPLLYVLLLLLMLLNWSLETLKWRYLLKPQIEIGFFRALQAVWTGVAVSLFTPNRVGEFGGRMLFFKPEERVRSVSATLAGSLAQFTATILFGIVGAALYLNFGGHPKLHSGLWIFVPAALLFALSFYLYFKIDVVSRWIEKRRWHKKISEAFHTLAQYDTEQLFVNLWFSVMRYLVFAAQMALVIIVMVVFAGDIDPGFMTFTVFTYFLIQTAVPSIALSEIGVRGSVLTLLFLHIVGSEQVPDLILAGTLIWFVNIIIPALFGSLFILKTKIR